jgi:hypothetical protein
MLCNAPRLNHGGVTRIQEIAQNGDRFIGQVYVELKGAR